VVTSSTGGTVAISTDLGINVNVVIPIVSTNKTAKIPVKTLSDRLLDILDGKNKRNVLKNLSQLEKKPFFCRLSAGVSVSSLTTVVSKTPIVPHKIWIIAVFQMG
jgi:hypothetical protein